MTEQAAREALLAKGVPLALLDVWQNRDSPLRLLSWSKPNLARAEELERLVPDLGGLCPIAEENGEAVIGLLPSTNRFVRYYYEDAHEGNAGIEILGTGYQQFAACVLLEFEDAGLQEEFTEVARILRFEKAAELRRLLDADPYDDEAVERFRSRLGS